MIRRDSQRASVDTLGYFGEQVYLAERFRSQQFRQALAKRHVELKVITDASQWHDYHDIDCIIAVRDISAYDLLLKPPSKLINAWRAGCPALLGPEPAYRALRQSDLDYIEVHTTEQAIAAIKRLRDDPQQFRDMVNNGDRRAYEFSEKAITRMWVQLLSGPVTERFAAWRRTSCATRAVRFACRALRHRRARAEFRRRI